MKKLSPPRLRLEPLEDRCTPAGNVQVTLSGADLKITGDDLENAVQVRPEFADGNPTGNVVVVGLADAAGNPTTVNGEAEVVLPTAGLTLRNINVDLKKAATPSGDARGALGADTLRVENLQLAGGLTVKGAGGASVFITETTVQGATSIKLKDGLSRAAAQGQPAVGSEVVVMDSALGVAQGGRKPGGLSVATGKDADHVVLFRANVGKDLSVATGRGDDEVFVTDSGVGGNAKLELGDGHNTAFLSGTRTDVDGVPAATTEFTGNLTVSGTNGPDCLGLLGVLVRKNFSAKLGNGDNFAGAADLAVLGSTSVVAGKGNDTVAIGLRDADGNVFPADAKGNFLRGNVTVNTAAGNDLVAAQGTAFGGKLTVNLAAGDDRLAELNNDFARGATAALANVRGAGGRDTLLTALLDEEFEPDVRIANKLGFEVLNPAGGAQQVIDAIFAEVTDCFPWLFA